MKLHAMPYFAIFLLFMLINPFVAQSQRKAKDKEKAAKVAQLLDSKKFAFKVQSALPMRGGTINVTSDYDLVLKGDTVRSYLPYFGRAFSAPIGQLNSPLDFTTTNFTYTSAKGKRGSREINIEFKDSQVSVRKYYLNVSELGYATLQTTSNNRDPITFHGYITETK